LDILFYSEGERFVRKRIILLLDGTWNDSDFGPTDTNVVRLREAISKTLNASGSGPAPISKAASTSLNFADSQQLPSGSSGPKVSATVSDNLSNIVFYERGVGTGAFIDRFTGGAFGEGLAGNIRRAYKFLSFHYEPGDQIFIFGFSRGAYTARSLVGYIHAAGLLLQADCTADLEQEAWDFYRCPPNDRLPGEWAALTPHVHDRDKFRIALLGVFDTVGALGIPTSAFRIANRDKYEFHDVELSATTDVNLHALAIDEQREAFEATVWRRSKFKNFQTKTEQVWFSGVHADIGGGYINEELRSQNFENSLDDISLDWIIKRVKFHYKDFPINDSAWPPLDENSLRKRLSAKVHRSRRGFYLLTPRAFRSIANVPVPHRTVRLLPFLSSVNVGRDRHASIINESIHISALYTLSAPKRGRNKSLNLRTVLRKVEKSYSEQDFTIGVVGWSGELLDPDSPTDRKMVIDALQEVNQLRC